VRFDLGVRRQLHGLPGATQKAPLSGCDCGLT
jgi:hypothetical protein